MAGSSDLTKLRQCVRGPAGSGHWEDGREGEFTGCDFAVLCHGHQIQVNGSMWLKKHVPKTAASMIAESVLIPASELD